MTRYVEVKVLKSGGDQLDSYASMAEINFYAAEAFKADDVDTTQLKLAVDTAKALNAEDYVQNAAWTALEDAIAEAEEMIESPRSQAVVNKHCSQAQPGSAQCPHQTKCRKTLPN